jgi:hypothetical protein
MEIYQPVKYEGWRGYVRSDCAVPEIISQFTDIRRAIRRGDATIFLDSNRRAVAMISQTIKGRSTPLLVKIDDVTQSGFRVLLKSHVQPSRAHGAGRYSCAPPGLQFRRQSHSWKGGNGVC